MRKLLLWLAMVIAMVALILGGTAAFLYQPHRQKKTSRRRLSLSGTPPSPPTGGIGPSPCWATK